MQHTGGHQCIFFLNDPTKPEKPEMFMSMRTGNVAWCCDCLAVGSCIFFFFFFLGGGGGAVQMSGHSVS